MVQFKFITKKIKKNILTISFLAFLCGFLMAPLLSVFQDGLLSFDINIEDPPVLAMNLGFPAMVLCLLEGG